MTVANSVRPGDNDNRNAQNATGRQMRGDGTSPVKPESVRMAFDQSSQQTPVITGLLTRGGYDSGSITTRCSRTERAESRGYRSSGADAVAGQWTVDTIILSVYSAQKRFSCRVASVDPALITNQQLIALVRQYVTILRSLPPHLTLSGSPMRPVVPSL